MNQTGSRRFRAPVTDQQLSHWLQHYQETELVVAYGSTEAEPVGHIEASERIALAAPGQGFCTGQPTDQIETKIIPISKQRIDLDKTPLDQLALPAGEIGELIVAGDHVCRDYYKNENATRENKLIDREGKLWHRMGDTGYFDDHNRFGDQQGFVGFWDSQFNGLGAEFETDEPAQEEGPVARVAEQIQEAGDRVRDFFGNMFNWFRR